MLRKSHNVLCDTTPLGPLSQSLPRFKGIVCWLEIPKQRSLKVTPTLYITLHLIPSVSLPLKQTHSNLPSLGVIFQINQFKVDVKLMDKL